MNEIPPDELVIIQRYAGHNPGYSHAAALTACVLRADGPILELGMGAFSTPLLHALAFSAGKQLVSIETDRRFSQYFLQYRRPYHEILELDSYDDYPVNPDFRWGTVLIDHASERRAPDLLRFRNHATYLVAHDSEDAGFYGYVDVFPQFKYRFDYRPCPVYTTVLSQFDDLSWLQEL